MKNVYLGLIFMLVLLPQVSFGQTTPTTPTTPTTTTQTNTVTNSLETTCLNKYQADGITFFTKQGAERSDWIKAHQDVLAKQDEVVHRWGEHRRKAIEDAKKSGDWTKVPPGVLPAFTDSGAASFVAKQQSDKMAFMAGLEAARKKCLSGQ